MKAFIWEFTTPVSSAWHAGGGLMIVAENIDVARDSWTEYVAVEHEGDSGSWPDAVKEDPDHELTVIDAEPRVLVFPDSGCC